MAIFANVRGEIKELYRIFFNDNGVIREFEVFYAQNDNNEVKRMFVRNSNLPRVIPWVAYDGDQLDDSTVNSVTNKGYTINARFSNKKRSIATQNKIYLIAGTLIRAEVSNVVYHSGVVISDSVHIHLFSTESYSDDVQTVNSATSSITMTVQTSGNYYISLSIYGKDASGVIHYCTADVNISILPPKNG